MRILVAEDERDLNRILVEKLTRSGYTVDTCYDGAEAIHVLAYTEYDAVILDIMMPKPMAMRCFAVSEIRERQLRCCS